MIFTWKKAIARLAGNFCISFGTPLIGTQIILQPEFIQSVYVALISSAIVTLIVAGQILDKYSRSKANGTI